MSSHEALTQAVVGTGRKLVQAGHFAARDVAARVQQLEDAMGRLRAEAAQRRRRLQQAQEAQYFLTEVRGAAGHRRWHEDTQSVGRPGTSPPGGAPGSLCISTNQSPDPEVFLQHVSQKMSPLALVWFRYFV